MGVAVVVFDKTIKWVWDFGDKNKAIHFIPCEVFTFTAPDYVSHFRL